MIPIFKGDEEQLSGKTMKPVSFLFYMFKEIIEVGNKMLQNRCMQYKIVVGVFLLFCFFGFLQGTGNRCISVLSFFFFLVRFENLLKKIKCHELMAFLELNS